MAVKDLRAERQLPPPPKGARKWNPSTDAPKPQHKTLNPKPRGLLGEFHFFWILKGVWVAINPALQDGRSLRI